jgi:16S rRNA (cytosine967-C5)-methyltransferase
MLPDYHWVGKTLGLMLDAIEYSGVADETLRRFFKDRQDIGSHQRRMLTDLYYDSLRNWAKIHWWMKHLKLETKHRSLLWLVLNGQITLQEKWAKTLGHHGLCHPKMPDWVQKEIPEFCLPWIHFGDHHHEAFEALSKEAPFLDIRFYKTPPPASFTADPTPYSPYGFRLHEKKPLDPNLLAEVQDEGSQLINWFTQAKIGQKVLDFCAGGGGKSLGLAQDVGPNGSVLSLDIDQKRLNNLKKRAQRHQFSQIKTQILTCEHDPILMTMGLFDRVLVDAPCSGSGTWRRNPWAKWHLTPLEVHGYVARQRRILAAAQRHVKPKAWLIYATCSIFESENTDQIAWFLDQFPQFSPVDLTQYLPTKNFPKIGFNPFGLQLSPHAYETDGFFICALEKNNSQR